MDAAAYVRAYLERQASLCAALLERYPVNDQTLLLDLPAQGTVAFDESFWEFQKHGKGVRFCRIPAGEIVDVPVGVVAHPGALDAWRLLGHLESREIENLRHGTQQYCGTDERELQSLLRRLCEEGVLIAVEDEKGLYALPPNPTTRPRDRSVAFE